jgi:dTDP-4-dehydrorhamnose 3,5-epimerase-like enzyme/nucleoside-diphosphate-sugar epimerase
MKILVTGAKGFVGKNLCATLYNIRDGKDRTRPGLKIDEVFEYDIDTDPALLDEYCRKCDFVFNLAGVNRPKETSEFMEGNFGFASTLLETLKKHGNRCPVMLSSSQQASLTGRFGNSEYGRSKKAGEDLFLEYEREFLLPEHELSINEKAGILGEHEFAGIEHELSINEKAGLLAEHELPEIEHELSINEKAGLLSEHEFAGIEHELSINNGLRPRVLIYRFPNLFGKWCRPNYNSAVATFCNAFANDLPYTVNDPSVELELLYIDDLVDEMLDAMCPLPTSPDRGGEHRCEFDGLEVVPKEDGRYCYCPVTHKVTLGRIVELLHLFAEQPKTLMIPEIPEGSFEKKLYSTFLSYLPKEKVAFPLKMNIDDRGSFTELVHTLNCGQVSINISKPGITKGQHWHHTKWEFFIVVSGHGLIQERKIGTDEVIEFEVSGDNIQCIHMLPGYTHNIINLSETENLVTVMYCNEIFDPNKPDTFFEKV